MSNSRVIDRFILNLDSGYQFSPGRYDPPIKNFTDLWDEYSYCHHEKLVADREDTPLEAGKKIEMLHHASEGHCRTDYGVIIERNEESVTIQFEGSPGLRRIPVEALTITRSPANDTVHCVLDTKCDFDHEPCNTI